MAEGEEVDTQARCNGLRHDIEGLLDAIGVNAEMSLLVWFGVRINSYKTIDKLIIIIIIIDRYVC